MRKVYRNPKELATYLKDMVEMYFDDLMTYEKMEAKIKEVIEANEERFFKNGNVDVKGAKIIGESNMEVINKIIAK